jgi:phage terminase Nu1 subunit (DNA packaging protein)
MKGATRDQPPAHEQAQGAGLTDYLREAFLFRWNLLFFAGGVAGAAILPMTAVLLPLVAAGEVAYLAGLITIPRFRAAIDAKVQAAGRKTATTDPPSQPAPSLTAMLGSLPLEARRRFERLHTRCLEMRGIAAGVRGAAGDQGASAEEIRTPGLDRLLWLFLRLLLSRTALDRFLGTMSNEEISKRLDQLRKDFAAAQTAKDDRIMRSLQDSIAMAELRLDNYERAKKNAQFVSIELDRIEGKIQALAEMSVNRQDPDFLSSQVDSAAESMRQTEKAVSELQHLTGLADELQEPPPILESDLREVLRHEA